jgi:hypothetical protein
MFSIKAKIQDISTVAKLMKIHAAHRITHLILMLEYRFHKKTQNKTEGNVLTLPSAEPLINMLWLNPRTNAHRIQSAFFCL